MLISVFKSFLLLLPPAPYPYESIDLPKLTDGRRDLSSSLVSRDEHVGFTRFFIPGPSQHFLNPFLFRANHCGISYLLLCLEIWPWVPYPLPSCSTFFSRPLPNGELTLFSGAAPQAFDDVAIPNLRFLSALTIFSGSPPVFTLH